MGKLRFDRTGKRVSLAQNKKIRFGKRLLLRAAHYAADIFGISPFSGGMAGYVPLRRRSSRLDVRGLIERCISEVRSLRAPSEAAPSLERFRQRSGPCFAIETLEPRQLLSALDVSSFQPPNFLKGATMSNMLLAGIVGDGSSTDYTVTIDWGDGTSTSTGTVTRDENSGDDFDVNGSHQYASLGNYTATLTLKDSSSNVTLDTETTVLTTIKSPLIAVNQFNVGPGDMTDLTPNLVPASDGSVWFIDLLSGGMGKIAPGAPTPTLFAVPSGYYYTQLAAGPDGNIWAATSNGSIVESDSNGTVTDVWDDSDGSQLTDLVLQTQSTPTLYFLNHGNNTLGSISTDGSTIIGSYSLPIGDGQATDLTISGSALWLYDQASDDLILSGSGVKSLPSGASVAGYLTADGHGGVWLLDSHGYLDDVSQQDAVVQYYVGSIGDMALGADGNIWFTTSNRDSDQIETIVNGSPQSYSLSGTDLDTSGLVLGPDGELWLSSTNDSTGDSSIDEVKTNGSITEYPFPTAWGNINGLVFGGDGNLDLSLKENSIGSIAQVVLNEGATINMQVGQSLSSIPVALFNDLNESAVAGDFTATINWGNSYTSNGTVVAITNPNYSFAVDGTAPSAPYTTPGIYNTTITVTDSDGDQTVVSGTITVASVPAPHIQSTSNSTVTVQSSYSLSLSTPGLTDDTITGWKINWGDGSNSTISGDPSTANHTYSSIGSFAVSATASDAFGNYTASGNLTVTSIPKTDTWNGTSSSNWSLSTNWTNGVPDSLTAVTIPTSKTVTYTSLGSSTVYSLTLNGNSTLTVSNGTLRVLSTIQANGTLSVQGGTLWGGTSIAGNGFQYSCGTLKSIVLSGTLAWNSSNVSQLANVSNSGDILLSNSSINASNITYTGGTYEVASNISATGNLTLSGAALQIDSGYTLTWSASNGTLNNGTINNYGDLTLGNESLAEATGSTAPINNYGTIQWGTSNLSLMPYTNNQGNITFTGGGLGITQPGQYISNGSAYTLSLSANATLSGYPWTWTVKWGDGAVTQATGDTANVTLPADEDASPMIQVSAVISGFSWTAQNSTLSVAVPTNLVAVGGNEAVTLNWQDTNTSVVGFEIDQSTNGANFTFVHNTLSGASNYTISGLSPSTTYFYRVRAFDSSGNFTFATAASTTTAGTPIAPSGFGATPISSSEINLAWTDGSGAETGFVIERSIDGTHFSQIATVGSNVTSYSATELAAGTAYSFRLAAYDAAGNSDYSNSANATTSSGAAIVTEGNPYTLSLSTTAPSVDFWTINWGDGSTSAPDIQTISGDPWNATHTYANGGNYTISSTATDGATTYVSANTTVHVDPNGPTIATAANETIDGSGLTATLSALGADPDGESTLTYTWSTLGTPPAPVSFSTNGNNAAKETVATFTATGTYEFLLTISNADNQTITKSISVPVTQIPTTIVATPHSPAPVAANGTQQFSAVEYDQFGIPLATQPTSFSWGVTGTGYTISSAGLLTLGSGDSPGNYSVNANETGISANSPYFYFSSKIAVSCISQSALDTTTHTMVNLSASASDPIGSSGLTYTWVAASDSPAPVSFSDNSDNTASNTTAVFSKAGTYHLTVVVSDGNANAVTSNITVTVGQTLSIIDVTTTQSAPSANAIQQFSAAEYDQFGNQMDTFSNLTWSVDNGDYSMSNTGLLTAGTTIGGFSVSAANGSVSSTSLHFSAGPTVTQVANATIDSSGTFATLQVDATDYSGGADLIFTWSVIGGDADNVMFSDNADETASGNLAFFTAAGNYTLLCTITSPSGLSLTSSVDVSVNQVLISIATVAQSGVPNAEGTQQFVATAYDQFGNPLVNQPNVVWTSSNLNDPISGGGLLVAAGSPGEYSVTANYDGISSTSLSFSSVVTIADSPSPNPVTGDPTSVNLTVLGDDPDGESTLSYSWSVMGNPPGSVVFSDNFDNSAKNTNATFSASGSYDLLVTITDQNGYSTTSPIVVTMAQDLTSIHVTSSQPSPVSGGNQQFIATGYDQFGNPMAATVTWTKSGTGYSIGSSNGTLHLDSGSSPGAYSVTATNGAISATVTYTPALTIVNAANWTPDSSNTLVMLTVLGTDASGGSDLTYTWSATGANAADVSFGDIYANNTDASFSAAGNYTLQVTIQDAAGDSVTSPANVSIGQVASGISIYTNAPTPAANGTQQFSSVEYDQFGNAMVTQPAMSWSVVGTSYSFPSTPGLLHAGSTTGEYSVTASDGTGNVTITSNTLSFSHVVTVATAANATLNAGDTSANLTVLGADPAGESDLTYVWTTAGTTPGPVTFSDNATNTAKDVTATFTIAGTYDFTVEIIDSDGLETTAHVTANVTQVLTNIGLTSPTAAPLANANQTFTATEYDQFGTPMASLSNITWSISGTGYTDTPSNATCVVTAPATTGNYTVTATSGSVHTSVSSSSNLTIKNAANGSVDSSGTFGTLLALGTDALGGGDLTYTWTLTSDDPDNVVIEDNQDNSACQTIVDFFGAGNYTFLVTITDPSGANVTSCKTLRVDDIASSIVLSTTDPVPLANGTQQFAATVYDQFGNVMASQPTLSWGISGTGHTIDSSTGLVTACSTPEEYTVYASNGSLTGSTESESLAPVIQTPANATAQSDHESYSLSGAALDMSGTSDLTYDWSADSGDDVSFSDNDGNTANVTATFDEAGTYHLTLTVSNDAGLSVSSNVTVTMDQVLTSIEVSSNNSIAAPGGTVSYTTVALDQFGDEMTSPPSLGWSVTHEDDGNSVSGNGTVGTVTAGTSPGTYTVTATDSNTSIQGTASFYVMGMAYTPVLNTVNATVDENSGVIIDLMSGDTAGDPAGRAYVPYSMTIASQPENGHVSYDYTPEGGRILTTITYTPDSGFTGDDSFTIETANSDWLGGEETVNVEVDPVDVDLFGPANVTATGSVPVDFEDTDWVWTGDGDGRVELLATNPEWGDPEGRYDDIGGTATLSGSMLTISGAFDQYTSISVSTNDQWTGPLSVVWEGADANASLSVTSASTRNVNTSARVSVSDGGEGEILSLGNVTGSTVSVYEDTGTINGTVNSNGSLYIHANEMHGNVTANGNTSISMWGNMIGSVTDSSGNLTLEAGRDITGDITDDGLLEVSAGRDLEGSNGTPSEINATNIGYIIAGRDLTSDIDSGGNVTAVEAGGTITGNITAESGNIGGVTAGENWQDPYTMSGSMSNLTIDAGTSVGNVIAEASVGYDGAMSNVTITAEDGSIGSITAATGIGVTANATVNIGNISTTDGDITGNFTAGSGNIGLVSAGGGIDGDFTASNGSIGSVTASNGSFSGSLLAGVNIGDITIYADITGNITASNGNIGNIAASNGNITSTITSNLTIGDIVAGSGIYATITSSAGSIGNLMAGDGINGNISASQGSIGNVYAGDSVSSDITAQSNIGNISTQGSLSGNITSQDGSLGFVLVSGDSQASITSATGDLSLAVGGDLLGSLEAAGAITANALGNVSGNITSTQGFINLFAGNNITSKSIMARGDVYALAIGNIHSNFISQDGSAGIRTFNQFSGSVVASINAFVGADSVKTATLKATVLSAAIANDVEDTTLDYDVGYPVISTFGTDAGPSLACFAAGTPILLSGGGSIPIEKIEPGMQVLSVSEHEPEGARNNRKVVEVFHNPITPIFEVRVFGHCLRTTAEHPFFVRGRGWIPAKELLPGDMLLTARGEYLKIESAELTPASEPVYNLRVEHDHTYFVPLGESGHAVLVHNDYTGNAAVVITPAQRTITNTVIDVIDQMKQQKWTPSAPAPGKLANPGAFGTAVHEQVSAKLSGQKGWLTDVFVDNETKKIVSIGTPPPGGLKGTTQIDAMAVTKGSLKVGDVVNSNNVEVFDIKNSVSGQIRPDQLKRLQAIAGNGKVTAITPPEIYKPGTLTEEEAAAAVANGEATMATTEGVWKINSKFKATLGLLALIGMTDKAIAVCHASDYDAELADVQQKIQYARIADPGSADRIVRTTEAQQALKTYLSHFVPGSTLDSVFLAAFYKTLNDN